MPKKIKILNLSSHLGIGGSEVQLRLASLLLSPNFYNLAIIIYNKSEHYVFNDELRNRGIKIFQCNSKSVLLKLIYTLFVIIKFKPDIIHSWNSYINPIAYFFGKLFFIKKIIGSFRGSPLNELSNYKNWKKKFFLLGDKIVVNSTEIIIELKEIKLDSDKVIFIPNLIEENKIPNQGTKNKFLKEYKISNNDIIIVNIGNYRPEKNQKFLIEIIHQMSKSIPNIKCLIVGQKIEGKENIYLELCENIDKYNLKEKVILTGFIKDSVSIIDLADIYIHTSISEGTSNAIIEAMRLKKCIVTTDVGGAKALITNKENGLILPHNKINEQFYTNNFSNNLIELIKNNKLRETYGKNAYNFLAINYNNSKTINLFDNIYKLK
ncbi:MAG: glycosyltransferase family 4 protein [Bacteroidia bacterium]|nr:glycosyltransferase family 4 protein [Bacteroidia bacterium]